jgi:hypothetical protein
LVSLDPANPTYRLELAIQLEATAQADRARYHFEIARGADLSPAVAADVAQRIDRIDRNKSWEGFFKFALIPESNAAKRTDAETVFIGSLPVTLAPSSRPKPAQGVNIGAGIALLPALSRDLRARVGVSVDARLFDGAAPDDVNLRGELGLLALGDRNRALGAGLLLGQRWIDGDVYSAARGGYLSFGQTLGAAARSNLSLTLLHDRTDYARRGLADLDRTILSARLTHLVTPQLQLRLGAQLDHSDSRAAWERGRGAGVTLGARYAFAGGLLVDLEISAQKNKRDAVDPFFLILREDSRRNARLRLTNRNWSFHGFAPVLELGVERQDSTNTFYDYSNTSALLGFTRQF